jgi:uncharacterized protein (DUF1697 family)
VTRYVGFLRGVNVGGRNRLPMAELRTLAESLGYADVRTFIQSGNLVFSASGRVAPAALEAAIATHFGLEVPVVLRTAAELEAAVRANPFAAADLSRLHVGFMAGPPAASGLAVLERAPFLPEEFAVQGADVYLYLPEGVARTKLPRYLERRLGLPMTVRNWKTLGSLAELARG